jgi:hypothetical protein
MAPCPAKVCAAINGHEQQEVLLQHLLVPLPIHCHVPEKEEDANLANTKTVWMFESLDSVLQANLLELVGLLTLIQVALTQQKVLSPLTMTVLQSCRVDKLLGKSQPMALIFSMRRGFLSAILDKILSLCTMS